MRTLKNIICVLLVGVLICNTSCELKKDLKGQTVVPSVPGEELPVDSLGLLDLQLTPPKEAVPKTKAISGSDVDVVILESIKDFSVDILDEKGAVVMHYNTYQEMKESGELLLPAGKYSIVAQLGELVEAGFDMPFYEGKQTCTINPKEVARVITKCALANKKLVIECKDDFLDKYNDDYSIVLTNGNGVLNTYKGEERVAYFKSSDKLDMYIYASSKDGKDYVFHKDIMDDELLSQYNSIHVTLEPDSMFVPKPEPDPEPDPNPTPDPDPDPDDPNVTPGDTIWVQGIKVDITLLDNEVAIVIPSDFIKPGDSDDEEKPDGDTPTEPTIKGKGDLVVGKPYTVTATSKVAVTMTIPTGLKALSVVADVKGAGVLNFDMLNLDSEQAKLFSGVTLPKKNQKGSITFDISGFMGMLSILSGEHTFTITLTDNNGKFVKATLILVVK